MSVNPKKSIVLKNRTNYFIPDKDKVRVRFSSPLSYQSRKIKIEGYENRLYWQFRYCQEHNGQTFFYTLTYNDRNLPKMYGLNCFDYFDLRELFTGAFRKILLRKYGTVFKYFVGAELGDGKGSRGMHNNPHYHLLLFLEPDPDAKFPYQVIPEKDMTHLLRLFWQGVDQDDAPGKFFDYRLFRKGVVKEGSLGALVSDYRAVAYCAKYVTKDVSFVRAEPDIEKKLLLKFRNLYRYKDEVFSSFFHSVVFERFNTPLNAKKTLWSFGDIGLIQELVPETYSLFLKQHPEGLKDGEVFLYQPFVSSICDKYGLWSSFYDYLDSLVAPLVKEGINEWRNRYSNKCRISHGVGDYALKHIKDNMNPSIQFPSKDGFKQRPISQYFYRKLFCDVVKDSQGQNLYVLNDLGISYKSACLSKQIWKTVSKCQSYFPLLLGNEKLYNDMCDSDINTLVFWSHSDFVREFNSVLLNDSLKNVLRKYAEYKLVYEDRFFTYRLEGMDKLCVFPPIDVHRDFKRFIVPSFYSVSRNDLRLTAFLEDIPENYLPYSQHPYFLRYIGLFAVLDMCADYLFVKKDDNEQAEAEKIASTKRFFVKAQLKSFYSSLN